MTTTPGADGDRAGEDEPVGTDRREARAELLPEEQGMPVQDPSALAEEVLEESDERTADPDAGLSGTQSGTAPSPPDRTPRGPE